MSRVCQPYKGAKAGCPLEVRGDINQAQRARAPATAIADHSELIRRMSLQTVIQLGSKLLRTCRLRVRSLDDEGCIRYQ